MIRTSLRRRLFASAAGLVLSATTVMAFAAPAQANQGEESTTPPDTEEEAPPAEEPTEEPPATEPPAEPEESPFETFVTCEFLVFVFPNEFSGDLSFSLTPNQDTTAGNAPDWIGLPVDEDGFFEVPEGIGLEDAEAVSADEPIELGPVAPGETLAHGFEAAAGLEVSVEATVDGDPVEIDDPVVSFDEAVEGLGCDLDGDDGEGGELPVTGNTTLLIAGGAAALLALGGGLFLIARRRRVTFTA